ncbi:MAG: hypothetical protein SFW67_09100 [Myxococcaceae bacterium]|nr:hypothetical protein [Myxococcaceae bacterium]
MDVVLQHTPQVMEDEPAADDIEALARVLRERPTTRNATRFTMAVEGLVPGAEAARALAQVAELVASVDRLDVDGRWCLEVVVEKWLSFGYPWALELPPELLACVQRRRAESGSNGWAVVTLVSAILSGCWYAFLLVAVSTAVRRSEAGSFDLEALLFGGFAVMCLGWLFELLRTMATAALTDRDDIERAGQRLRNVGQVMWLAPAGVASCALLDVRLAFLVGMLLAPLSITGAAARLSARRLRLALR